MRIKLLAMASSLTLGMGLALINAGPAQAAPNITICNNAGSADSIQAYRISSPFQEALIGRGQCATMNDAGGAVRVDVDPSGGSADIDSWKKRHIGDTWNVPCYNDENGASNPYSDSVGTSYWTFETLNCEH